MTRQTDAATAALIAAALAKKGVTKIAVGESNGMTARQWYRAARDSDNARVVEDYSVEEALSEREREIGAAHGVAGVNDFREGVRKNGASAMLGWK
jgi:hypothetical protein